jgi:class 3 adenylate cyclase/tetratricopeptide (TPR) repeat protein
MVTCFACGRESPDGFQFCGFCGTPLAPASTDAPHEERKVVSVLFCDLVGFTATSEHADPEDVRARLRPYHDGVRSVLERHGGTVEKFVGDAVMAVFGAPVTHEDDAERAVRAGLRILEEIAQLNDQDPELALQVRVGVNTGEAVVALQARPELGEAFVTGDVVNTAARVQSAAPVDAVAVAEATFRATDRVFDFTPLEQVPVKGKVEPLRLWQPLQPRARFGADVTRSFATPLVGRDADKAALIASFERAASQRSCQLVTVVGEPGVGKSRLGGELFSYVEQRPGLVRWRQGRCLPYGDGIAFWALGEIVKADAGILESDSPARAAAKLERIVPPDIEDREWLLSRIGPLVGVPGAPAAQDESFAAWRRFCELLAADSPCILVVEDLHWADDALLAFLEHLADWAQDVPLLVLCTTRPELFEQHPHFGSHARNAQRINLAPLSDRETVQLFSLLLERAVLPEPLERTLLEHAGGNPLYAEEFVRLLSDRDLLTVPDELQLPESLQALIAARLDTLSADRKALLQDAAVVGKVFWAGAVAEMGGRDLHELEQALHELSRKELVRPARVSAMQGEREYGFWHALVRDVCYQQIPRAVRAAKHRAAAAWIEEQAGEGADDLADVLAHHYLTALELQEATGAGTDPELHDGAVRYLALAGERALPLDLAHAESSLSRALELAPAGHPRRADLLESWAAAALQQMRPREVRTALEEALAIHRASGDRLATGHVLTRLSVALGRLGDPLQEELLRQAITTLEAEAPSPELVDAYSTQAARRCIVGDYPEAIAVADKALALAARLGATEPARALGYRGLSRAGRGEQAGLDDVRVAIAVAAADGESRTAALLQNNLCIAIWQFEGAAVALAAGADVLEYCRRRGITETTVSITAMSTTWLVETGETQEALARSGPMADELDLIGDIVALEPRSVQLLLHARRGDRDDASLLDAAERLVSRARETGEPQMIGEAWAAAVELMLLHERSDRAHTLLLEIADLPVPTDIYWATYLPTLHRSALRLGDSALARRLTDGVPSGMPIFERALSSTRAQQAEAEGAGAEAASLYAEAAAAWGRFDNRPEQAFALLGQGRALRALADPLAAEKPLLEARALFERMEYGPFVATVDALIRS